MKKGDESCSPFRPPKQAGLKGTPALTRVP
jgi:hypothetical protein